MYSYFYSSTQEYQINNRIIEAVIKNKLYIEKLFNLGVLSRVLLVLVKPLSLWGSLQLDSDNGVKLAEIFLIGILFVSLSGTNAHRRFYKTIFGPNDDTSNITIRKNYIFYINQISFQLIIVIPVVFLISCMIFYGFYEVVFLGVLFGFAEKINDEYQRYAQFSNNSLSLFTLACVKLLSGMIAIAFSFFHFIEIWIALPVLLLSGTVIINYKDIRTGVKLITFSARRSIKKLLITAAINIKNDIAQIAWVFTSMSLLSLDKWMVQYMSVNSLPKYMLFTQIASIAVVAQTIFLIAPVRVRLMNENPDKIQSLKIGTPLVALIPFIVGLVYLFLGIKNESLDNLEYFAFFLAAILTFTAVYSERLYWIVQANHRITLDALILVILIVLIGFILTFIDPVNKIIWCLSALVAMLSIRVGIMIFLLRKREGAKVAAS